MNIAIKAVSHHSPQDALSSTSQMKKLKSLRVLPWSLSLQVTELGLDHGPDAQTVLFPTPAPLPACPVSFCPSKEAVAAGWAGREQPHLSKRICLFSGRSGEEIGRVLGYLKTKVPQQQVACGKRYQKPKD